MSGDVPDAEVARAVASLLAAGGSGAPSAWTRATKNARHELWRVQCGDTTSIVKVYRRRADVYFQHRWRREERALDLAARHAPGLGPRVQGALLVPDAWAVLVLEDLGAPSLAEHLASATDVERRQLLDLALQALHTFRALVQRHSGLFRALANQSDLDRLTRGTIRRRYAIALARLRQPTIRLSPTDRPRSIAPDAPWQIIDAELITPLVQAPRRVIHNGFSPLNLIESSGRMRVLDWETLAIAAPQFDLADLLTFPAWGLEPAALGAIARAATAHDGAAADAGETVFWLAAAERALTYAATLGARAARATATGEAQMDDTSASRRAAYLATFRLALERAGVPARSRRRVDRCVQAALATGA
jgi:hypothetical protein